MLYNNKNFRLSYQGLRLIHLCEKSKEDISKKNALSDFFEYIRIEQENTKIILYNLHKIKRFLYLPSTEAIKIQDTIVILDKEAGKSPMYLQISGPNLIEEHYYSSVLNRHNEPSRNFHFLGYYPCEKEISENLANFATRQGIHFDSLREYGKMPKNFKPSTSTTGAIKSLIASKLDGWSNFILDDEIYNVALKSRQRAKGFMDGSYEQAVTLFRHLLAQYSLDKPTIAFINEDIAEQFILLLYSEINNININVYEKNYGKKTLRMINKTTFPLENPFPTPLNVRFYMWEEYDSGNYYEFRKPIDSNHLNISRKGHVERIYLKILYALKKWTNFSYN